MTKKSLARLVFLMILLNLHLFAQNNIPEEYFSAKMLKEGESQKGSLEVEGIVTCNSTSVTIKGSVKGTEDDENGYDLIKFELWDDGELKDERTISVRVGETKVINIGLSFNSIYKDRAPGVGILSRELSFSIDPFYPVDTCKNFAFLNPIYSYLLSPSIPIPGKNEILLTGTVKYEFVPPKSNHKGLDYSKIVEKPCRKILVQGSFSGGSRFAWTDEQGRFYLILPKNTNYKISFKAVSQSIRSDPAKWLVTIRDNTNNDAMYTVESDEISTGTKNQNKTFTILSGWNDGIFYDDYEHRASAPFAILDAIYSAMKKVRSAVPNIEFPALNVYWSPKNRATTKKDRDRTKGELTTTHYRHGEVAIYVLGKADVDTDEFDRHVIAHEWGHYYEDKFSRADSIGGSHGKNDLLDIRVAFGEGWGNAFSAMVFDDPFYTDSFGRNQASGSAIDLESGTEGPKGWYSEYSIGRILYDLYDKTNSGPDALSLGFVPIHNIMTHGQKTTTTFTSIFSFISAMNDAYSANRSKVKDILLGENISEINDPYGKNRTNRATEYPYHHLTVGNTVTVNINTNHGTYNKLNNHQFIYFTIKDKAKYRIEVQRVNGSSDSNPNFVLEKGQHTIGFRKSNLVGREVGYFTLPVGIYRLDVYDANHTSSVDFNISITK